MMGCARVKDSDVILSLNLTGLNEIVYLAMAFTLRLQVRFGWISSTSVLGMGMTGGTGSGYRGLRT